MEPTTYPQFVPDQVLMATHLNAAREYLDSGQRDTRRHLLGVGIAAGMEPSWNSKDQVLSISAGCGITSSGYLARMDESTFTHYQAFDAVKREKVNYFASLAEPPSETIYELLTYKQAKDAEGAGGTVNQLDDTFLNDKFALAYVELADSQNKNCDPESCDSKGITVTVTTRALLVQDADVIALRGSPVKSVLNPGAKAQHTPFADLPAISMPPPSMPQDGLENTAMVLDSFLKPLSDQKFASSLEGALSVAFGRLKDLVADVFPLDPFDAFFENLQKRISQALDQSGNVLNAQYFYAHVSDIVRGYMELRDAMGRASGAWWPAEGFERHLVLGKAVGYDPVQEDEARHRFVPSPIMAREPGVVAALRVLMIRQGLLAKSFSPPQKAEPKDVTLLAFEETSKGLPSRVIPCYYDSTAKSGGFDLRGVWESPLDRLPDAGAAFNQGIGALNDVVRAPHAFIRVEGHLGKPFAEALKQIVILRNQYRIPFEVLAVSSDAGPNLTNTSVPNGSWPGMMARTACDFRDLQAQYAALRQQLVRFLSREMEYYYSGRMLHGNVVENDKPATIALLKDTNPLFKYKVQSLGDRFEQWLNERKRYTRHNRADLTVINSTVLALVGGSERPVATATGKVLYTDKMLDDAVFNTLRPVMYHISETYLVLPERLVDFQITRFRQRFSDLRAAAEGARKELMQWMEGPLEDQNSRFGPFVTELHLRLAKPGDVLDAEGLAAIDREFRMRWYKLDKLRRLQGFVAANPAVMHKGGTSLPGTLVLVYHDKAVPKAGEWADMEKAVDDQKITAGTVIADFYLPYSIIPGPTAQFFFTFSG